MVVGEHRDRGTDRDFCARKGYHGFRKSGIYKFETRLVIPIDQTALSRSFHRVYDNTLMSSDDIESHFQFSTIRPPYSLTDHRKYEKSTTN
jgi:hypothetical protein